MHLLGVFAALCATLYIAAHLFMPKAAYIVSTWDMTVADGPWRTAFKTDYLRNRALLLNRNQSGTLAFPVPDRVKATGMSISYYAFEQGSAAVVVRSSNRVVLGKAEIAASTSGKQAYVNLPLKDGVEAPQSLFIEVSSTSFRYLSIDQVTLSLEQGELGLGFALQAILASLLLVCALFVAQRFTIGAKVSTRTSWDFVDQLRGSAILLVVVLHSLGSSGMPSFGGWPSIRTFVYNGHYGVEVFYVVSAFTLTMSLLFAIDRGSNRYLPFMHNRFTRIVPTFAVVFLLAMLFRPLIVDNAKPLTASMVIDNLFLSHIFDPASRVLPLNHSVWWSIATEFQFYLVLPFLVTGLARCRGTALLPVALAVFLALALSLSIAVELTAVGIGWSRMSVFYHIDAFAFGIVAAFLFTAYGDRLRGAPAASRWFWLAGSVLLLLALTRPIGAINALALSAVRVERLQILVAVAVLLSAITVIRPGHDRRSFLANVGVLSFIVYLVHVPMLRVARDLLAPRYMGAEELYYLYVMYCGLALSLLASLVVHRVVEVPAGRWLKGRMDRAALAVSGFFTVVFLLLSLHRAVTGG